MGRAGTQEIRVLVPATSANLGPGFDSFALALDWHDQITVRATGDGVRIDIDGQGAGSLPQDERNQVVSAMREAFSRWGAGVVGLRVSCHNAVPQGRGLGSSAAAIVAGVSAARAMLVDGHDISDHEVLQLAARIEGHPDNVAACLFGGLTIAWMDRGTARCTRLVPHAGLHPVVFVPDWSMPTREARELLPASVPHADAVHNSARAALLVAAMTERPDLLLAATEDRLHQPFRAPAMPQTARLVHALRQRHVPAAVSGSGPAVLAFCDRDDLAEIAGPEWGLRPVAVDLIGARVAGPRGLRREPEAGSRRRG